MGQLWVLPFVNKTEASHSDVLDHIGTEKVVVLALLKYCGQVSMCPTVRSGAGMTVMLIGRLETSNCARAATLPKPQQRLAAEGINLWERRLTVW